MEDLKQHTLVFAGRCSTIIWYYCFFVKSGRLGHRFCFFTRLLHRWFLWPLHRRPAMGCSRGHFVFHVVNRRLLFHVTCAILIASCTNVARVFVDCKQSYLPPFFTKFEIGKLLVHVVVIISYCIDVGLTPLLWSEATLIKTDEEGTARFSHCLGHSASDSSPMFIGNISKTAAGFRIACYPLRPITMNASVPLFLFKVKPFLSCPEWDIWIVRAIKWCRFWHNRLTK